LRGERGGHFSFGVVSSGRGTRKIKGGPKGLQWDCNWEKPLTLEGPPPRHLKTKKNEKKKKKKTTKKKG